MAPPTSNGHVFYQEYEEQPPLQVAPTQELPQPPQKALENSQSYPEVVQYQAYQNHNGWTPPSIHVHPTDPLPSFYAELPVSIGPPIERPPTSTSPAQRTEDERLAQKLHQMEVARARSHSDLRQQAQHIPRKGVSSPIGQYAYQQSPVARPQSISLPSQYGPTPHSQASQSLLSGSPLLDPASFAPQVVTDRPASLYSVPPPDAPPGYTPPVYSVPSLVAQTPPPRSFTPSFPNTQPSPVLAGIAQHPLSAHLPPAPALEDRASLSAYLENNRQVPYPPQWVLPPISSTLYGSIQRAPKSDWLDQPEAQLWHSTRSSYNLKHPTLPSLKLSFKQKGGSFRDPRFSWIMTTPSALKAKDREKPTWTYELRLDRKTSSRVFENLDSPPSKMHKKGRKVQCTYLHAPNYSTLTFLGPDGRRYKWVSHAPVSSINGARFDTLRHALFVDNSANGNRDPLYGQIIADHCFWDGFTASGCLPDEALHIRSETEDIQFIVATLQVMKDWEKVTMREEKRESAVRFASSVELARKGTLGRKSYWMEGDLEGMIEEDECVLPEVVVAQEDGEAKKGKEKEKKGDEAKDKEGKKSKKKKSINSNAEPPQMIQQAMQSTLGLGLGIGGAGAAPDTSSSAGTTGSTAAPSTAPSTT